MGGRDRQMLQSSALSPGQGKVTSQVQGLSRVQVGAAEDGAGDTDAGKNEVCPAGLETGKPTAQLRKGMTGPG